MLVVLFVHPQANLLPRGQRRRRRSASTRWAAGHVDRCRARPGGQPYVVEFFEAGCAHCQQVAAQLCVAQRAGVRGRRGQGLRADGGVVPHAVRARTAATRCCSTPASPRAPAYSVNAVPTVYVVKDGKVVYAGAGLDGVNGLAAAVQKALGG